MDTYEKKYNEAFAWIRDIYPTLTGAAKEDAEHYFPELRESEDERIRKAVVSLVYEMKGTYQSFAKVELDKMVAWLEKQKEQKPAEWSDWDKDYYDTIVRKLEVIGDDSGLSNNQIKFLREHCPSHRSEWSESDDLMLQSVYETLYDHQSIIRTGTMGKIDRDYVASIDKEIAWLKSIRPSWKPSGEQMRLLKCSIDYYGSHVPKELLSLYEQLKKL